MRGEGDACRFGCINVYAVLSLHAVHLMRQSLLLKGFIGDCESHHRSHARTKPVFSVRVAIIPLTHAGKT
jgi:hypothetical protein